MADEFLQTKATPSRWHPACLMAYRRIPFITELRAGSLNPSSQADCIPEIGNGKALVAALAGLGIDHLPDGLIHEHFASGALVPVLTCYPIPVAGAYVIYPPGQHAAGKVSVLTDMLIECFGRAPHLAEAHIAR